MGKTVEERLLEVHQRAMARFDSVYDVEREMRDSCSEDRRFAFVTGAQWEGQYGEQFANRPRMEINKVAGAVHAAISEYRNNRISVDFRPRETEDDDIADTLDGLYRADEQESAAQEAYDNAFGEAVSGGIGAWRLRAAYEDDEDDEDDSQRIRIEPITDADTSVFFYGGQLQDKSDAEAAFLIRGRTKDWYESEYPDVVVADFPDTRPNAVFDWYSNGKVYVAEYYEVESKTYQAQIWRDLAGSQKDKKLRDPSPEQVEELTAGGWELARMKRCKEKRIHKYIIDGARVLEDAGYIAGKMIPIVMVYGIRNFVDGVERAQGMVRLAKDPQRLYNMEVSALADAATIAPNPVPIVLTQQIDGHEETWANANINRYPYLPLNPATDAAGNIIASSPVGFLQPPPVSAPMATLMQVANADIAEVLGSNTNADQIVANVSADAVEMTQKRVDMKTFIYMDNFAKAMRRCGEIWLSMARELYAEDGKRMRVLREDGGDDVVTMGVPTKTDKGIVKKNDISKGKYLVLVDVGPSFTSRRDATVKALGNLAQITEDPDTRAVLTAVMLQNMDGEGLQDIKRFNRSKLLRMGVVQPTKEEQAQMQQEQQAQQPDAQQQFLLSAAQKNAAETEKAAASTQKIVAETRKIAAETAEIASGMRRDDISMISQLSQGIQ